MNKHLYLAIQAAVHAGSDIMSIYEQPDLGIEHKEDDSPLTKADTASNNRINGYLSHSEFPVISEENRQIEYAKRKDWKTCWIVDPLDGTKEFIKRNGEFTVNIALCQNGVPILGVIFVPVTKELYYADVIKREAYKTVLEKGLSATELGGDNDRIAPAHSDSNRIRIVGSRSHMNEDTERFIEGLKKDFDEVEIVSKGSSLKFCLVAEGKADVYPRFAPTMEWDTAAGQALCAAVGLEVIDQQTQKPMVYNRENLLNAYFLVR